MFRKGLGMIFLSRHHHAVDQDAGDLDLPCGEGPLLRDPFDLHDHKAARILRRCRNGIGLKCERLLFHGHIPVRVRSGTPDDPHIDGKRFICKIFFPVKIDKLDEILLCAAVDLASAEPRVHIGLQPDRRDGSGLAGRDVPEQV